MQLTTDLPRDWLLRYCDCSRSDSHGSVWGDNKGLLALALTWTQEAERLQTAAKRNVNKIYSFSAAQRDLKARPYVQMKKRQRDLAKVTQS